MQLTGLAGRIKRFLERIGRTFFGLAIPVGCGFNQMNTRMVSINWIRCAVSHTL
jgi:hypothetical protein